MQENYLKRLEHKENLKYVDADDTSSFSALNIDYSEYHSPVESKSVIIPEDKTDKKNPLRLIGPKSPLETSMVPCLHHEKIKSVTVDHNSVNSVFLASTQQVIYITLRYTYTTTTYTIFVFLQFSAIKNQIHGGSERKPEQFYRCRNCYK